MAAQMALSVVLFNGDSLDQSTGNLVVEYDADASPDSAVDVRGDGNRLFSCSLDEAEAFAALLVEFVQHYRDRQAEPEEGED